MASLLFFRNKWKTDTWDCSNFRPSGASASMVRAFMTFRHTLVVDEAQSNSRSGVMASASRAAYFPVGHRHWVSH